MEREMGMGVVNGVGGDNADKRKRGAERVCGPIYQAKPSQANQSVDRRGCYSVVYRGGGLLYRAVALSKQQSR